VVELNQNVQEKQSLSHFSKHGRVLKAVSAASADAAFLLGDRNLALTSSHSQ
jgi:hypothetical protein